jgi:hypothetical protein
MLSRSTPLLLIAAFAGCSSSGGGGASPGDASTVDVSTSSGDASVDAPPTDATNPGTDAGGGIVDAPDESAIPGWTLTWSDEFDGPDGSAIDPTKWKHDVGGTGWGNQELEYYTDGTQNAVQQAGNLVITATTEGASQYQCTYPNNGACSGCSATTSPR